MSKNSMQQRERELYVFRRFISITGLPIDLNSIQQPEPPAPDILCNHAPEGPIGFELAELINHEFSARLGRQGDTHKILETLHNELPADEKQLFDQTYKDAILFFRFRPGTTTKKIRGNVSDVFEELSNHPGDFQGDINSFSSNSVSEVVESISVTRGGFTGPLFDVLNIGGIGDSVVPTIKNKLNKTTCETNRSKSSTRQSNNETTLSRSNRR